MSIIMLSSNAKNKDANRVHHSHTYHFFRNIFVRGEIEKQTSLLAVKVQILIGEKDKTIPVKKVRCTAASRSSVSLNISAAYQKWRVKSPGIETT